MDDDPRSDLDGSTCSIAGCFDPARGMYSFTIALHPLIGAAPDEEQLTIDFPRCIRHAHLLRMGGEIVAFNDGMQ